MAPLLPAFPGKSSQLQLKPNNFRKLEDGLRIPPILRPLLRAYFLGYASSTAPRLVSLILKNLSKNRKKVKIGNSEGKPKHVFFHSFLAILRGGLELKRFPTSCAVLVGGSTLLQIPIHRLLERLMKTLSSNAKTRCIATFISAYLSLAILQSKETPEYIDRVPPNTYDSLTGKALKSTSYGGRTLDLTLFAWTRAVDTIIRSLWQYSDTSNVAIQAISYLTDPFLFSASSAVIMWSYFYSPDRLPRNYTNWITTAAQIDPHLVAALRYSHQGSLVYGQTYPPNAPGLVLQDMCKEYGWPLDWGDPAKSIPFPCELVHMHCGPSCEYHALSRLVRSFLWALECNLPLNLLLNIGNPTKQKMRRAVVSSVRSSAFLASFIALFYYAICLARTRSQQFDITRKLFQKVMGIKEKESHPDFQMRKIEGVDDSSSSSASTLIPPSSINILVTPSLTPSSTQTKTSQSQSPPNPNTTSSNITPQSKINIKAQTHQAIDSGLAIGSGCVLCGWSILIESSQGSRRGELSLFVLPRALRTMFQRTYPLEKEWIERSVFAGCAVVLVEAVKGGGGGLKRPRGWFGKLVGVVLG